MQDRVSGPAAIGRAGQDGRARRRLARATGVPPQPSHRAGRRDAPARLATTGLALGDMQAAAASELTHAVLPVRGIDDGDTRIRCKARAGEDISRAVGLAAEDHHDRRRSRHRAAP